MMIFSSTADPIMNKFSHLCRLRELVFDKTEMRHLEDCIKKASRYEYYLRNFQLHADLWKLCLKSKPEPSCIFDADILHYVVLDSEFNTLCESKNNTEENHFQSVFELIDEHSINDKDIAYVFVIRLWLKEDPVKPSDWTHWITCISVSHDDEYVREKTQPSPKLTRLPRLLATPQNRKKNLSPQK